MAKRGENIRKRKSSNKAVASVTQKGVVLAKKPGTVKITATIKGTSHKAVCKVKVKAIKKSEWTSAYIDYLNGKTEIEEEFPNEAKELFALYDLNGDGVDELFVDGGGTMARNRLYTYQNGKVVNLFWTRDIILYDNGILETVWNSYSGYYTDSLLKLNNAMEVDRIFEYAVWSEGDTTTYSVGENADEESSPKVPYSVIKKKVKGILGNAKKVELHYYTNDEAGISSAFPTYGDAKVSNANESKNQPGEAYSRIIQRYLEALEAKQKNQNYDAISKYSDNELASGYVSEIGDFNLISEFMYEVQSETIAYRIIDFNKDGTPELFIGDSDGKLYAAFTFDNGKAIYLMSSFQTTKCMLCKNGIIARWVEGGAGGNVWIDQITKEKKLERVLELFSYHDGKKTVYVQTKNGEDEKISKANFDKLSKKYSKPVTLKFYKASQKAVKNIQDGKYTYKGQKSWKLKTK